MLKEEEELKSNKSQNNYMSAPSSGKKMSDMLKQQADNLMKKNCFKQAVSKYLNSVMLDKNNSKTYYALGLCYKNMNKISKAIENLEKSIILEPSSPEVFFELGLCHLKDESPCKAIKCFIQSIQMEPDNPEVIYNLGLAHEMAQEEDMALMIYQKLIENSPTYLNAYLRKSQLLLNMELYKQALGLYMNVLKINPKYTKIYSKIGLCFDKLGHQAYAKRFYKKFLSSEPNDEQTSFVLKRVEKLRQIKSIKTPLTLVASK